MRKVLLATTALVAMTGVTAANADISISGNYEWEYTSNDAGTTFGDDGRINVTAVNAADNGMTFTAFASLETGSSSSSNTEASYIQVDGEFGTIMLGDIDDSMAAIMDPGLGRNNDIETQVSLGDADTAIGASGTDIHYQSPKIGGLQIGLSKDLNDSDASSTDGKMDMAVMYSMGGVTLHYGSTDDDSNFGIKGSIAGFTIAAGAKKVDGSTAKANDVAVKYTLANGITLAALSANGTSSTGTKTKADTFGASYSIVPGVKLNAETGKVGTQNYTWVAVNMSF